MMKPPPFPPSTALVSILLVASSANASEANQLLPPEVVNAISDWSQCRAPKVAALIPTQQDVNRIVDQAFEECLDFENEAIRVWEQVYGVGSGPQVTALKARWRSSLVESVNAARSGVGPADLHATWGQCVGAHLPSSVPASAEASVLVDEALAACSGDFARLREQIAKQYGEKTAASQAAFLENELRKIAIVQIESEQGS